MMRRLAFLAVAIIVVPVAAGCASAPLAARTGGVVSSASPEATAAGVAILEMGGNAIDAAVAVQFALAVTEPAMSGLGGQTQILIHPPNGPPVMINGTSFAPGVLPDGDVPRSALRTGWTSTTIPSTVRVMDFAMRKFGGGKVVWADALAPAINYAEDGFVVGEFRHRVYARHAEDLKTSATAAPLFLKPDGSAPVRGDIVRQPVLAATLTRLAQAGADDFYTGEIATQIAADMKTHGGWITAADLAAQPQPTVVKPLHTTYRGHDVYTLASPAGGWAALQALNLLELRPAAELAHDDAARATALLAALQAAHNSRRANAEQSPETYEADIDRRITKAEALRIASAQPPANRGPDDERTSPSGETTHFSVVDKDGMAVSVTTSIDSYFGALVASPSLGFLYNNYMQGAGQEPGKAFSLRAGAPPYSSMSATIVAKDGKPMLALGSPGSARIISAVTQVASRWLDVEHDIVASVAAPRVHVVPDNDGRDNAYVEKAPPGLDVAALGFDLIDPQTDLIIDGRNAYFGGVHAVALQDGVWVGAADPRRDGAVGVASAGR